MEGKVCIQCNQFKPITSFDVAFKGQNAKNGFNQNESRKSRCNACYGLRDRIRTKLKFIAMYGGKCTCCDEVDPRFLTLDHVDSDGGEHRKDLACNQIMALAIKNYKPEKYQVLCFNCNCGKSSNGGVCPHQDKTLQEYLAYTEILLAPFVNESSKLSKLALEQQVQELLKKISPEDLDKLLARGK